MVLEPPQARWLRPSTRLTRALVDLHDRSYRYSMSNVDPSAILLEVARATVANTIMYADVERDDAGWTISAPVPAGLGVGVVLDLGLGRQEAGTIRGVTFEEALDRAVAAGVTTMADPKERFEELLRASKLSRF